MTNARSAGNSSSGIFAGMPPACWSGSTEPRSRCRRSTRETVASPTAKSSAISAYVPRPAMYASTTRFRRSNDVARPTLRFDHATTIKARGSGCRDRSHWDSCAQRRHIGANAGRYSWGAASNGRRSRRRHVPRRARRWGLSPVLRGATGGAHAHRLPRRRRFAFAGLFRASTSAASPSATTTRTRATEGPTIHWGAREGSISATRTDTCSK